MFEEYEILVEKLKEILPFEAQPTRELVQLLRETREITLKSTLTIISVFNTDDMGGIICAVASKEQEKDAVVCSLTHLVISSANPLFQEITQYQKKRIKHLKKIQGFR